MKFSKFNKHKTFNGFEVMRNNTHTYMYVYVCVIHMIFKIRGYMEYGVTKKPYCYGRS